MDNRGRRIDKKTLVLRNGRFAAAFSLVELLVVIAIVGVMMALLLPAIQAARESSRRNDCLSRLRQLALAVHNFESAIGHLPSGSVAQADPNDPTTPHTFYRWSAIAQVLPYMEHVSLRSHLDLSLPLYNRVFGVPEANRVLVRQIVASLLCPSDRSERVSADFGPTNYAACSGSGIEGGTPIGADGVFFVNSNLSMKVISDGTSRTIFLAECILGLTYPPFVASSEIDQRFAYAFVTAAPLTELSCDAATRFNFQDPPSFSWANGEYRSAMYNHFRPPNSHEFDCVSAKLIAPISERYAAFGWRSARSLHPGGVNAARADGSVQIYADDIDPAIWRSLSTRDGGETVNFDR